MSANRQCMPVETVHDDAPHMQLLSVFGALASIIKHDGIAITNAQFFDAALLQNMLEAVHATPLQMQGFGFAVDPSVAVHAWAAKQMDAVCSPQAVVEVRCVFNTSISPSRKQRGCCSVFCSSENSGHISHTERATFPASHDVISVRCTRFATDSHVPVSTRT